MDPTLTVAGIAVGDQIYDATGAPVTVLGLTVLGSPEVVTRRIPTDVQVSEVETRINGEPMFHARLRPVPVVPEGDETARRAVEMRRLNAVRLVLDTQRSECLNLVAEHRPGDPDISDVVASYLALLERAYNEVEIAERGCGQPDGECLDPCHVGVHLPGL